MTPRMSFDKAQQLIALLDRHQPHSWPGYGGRPPVATGRARKTSAHPLDVLYKRRAIDRESYVAGLRFRSDWELANVSGEGVTDWSRFDQFPPDAEKVVDELAFRRPAPKPVRRPPSGIPGARYDAKQTLARLRIVTGSFGFAILRGVCVHGLGLTHIADAIKVHRDYLSLRLKEALAEAAAFYGELIDSRDE